MTKPLVLIVEDEAPLVTLLRYNLEKEGFDVSEAADGEEALVRIAEHKPDIVLLDWMLPLVSGIEVCRQIRRMPQTRTLPVVMLTARGEEADRVRGLDSGADDYIAKPFGLRELAARLRAVIRRAQPTASEETLQFGQVTMDLAAHRVSRSDKPIHLGPTEFRLLRHLMQHPGRVFSREQLLDAVWGHDVYVEARTVDVHIRRLRRRSTPMAAPISSAPFVPPVTPSIRKRASPLSVNAASRSPRLAARVRRFVSRDFYSIMTRISRSVGRRRDVSARAALITAAVASSSAAMLTSTPDAHALTAAGPTWSMANTATEIGSAAFTRSRAANLANNGIFLDPRRFSAVRLAALNRAKVAANTLGWAPAAAPRLAAIACSLFSYWLISGIDDGFELAANI